MNPLDLKITLEQVKSQSVDKKLNFHFQSNEPLTPQDEPAIAEMIMEMLTPEAKNWIEKEKINIVVNLMPPGNPPLPRHLMN